GARRARQVIWLAGAAVQRIPALAASPAGRAVGLAQENRARRAHARDDGRVLVRNVVLELAQARGGGDARGVEDVLGRERDAMQRRRLESAFGQVAVGRLRLPDGALVGDPDHRVEARVDGADVLEVGAHDLLRRKAAVPDGARKPAGRGAYRVAHVGLDHDGRNCALYTNARYSD